MKSYVTYDEFGNLTGGFLQEIHTEHADCYIIVSDEIRLNWPNYKANSDRTGVELIN